MLSSDFLNCEEMQKLDLEHRLEGRGAITFIFEYLVDRVNGLGSFISIPSLARSIGKNKKFLLDIINNYGLFCSPEDSDIFYSPYLRTTIGLPEHPTAAELRAYAKGWKTLKKKAHKTTKKATKSSKKNQKSSNKVATFSKKVAKITPQLADNQQPHYIVDKDIDKDNRYNDSETTATAVVKAAAPSVFLTKMNSIFDDENWLKTLEGQTGIKLFSDMTIRKQLISWFDKRLIMSACNEEQGYKPRDAKKYLRNLLLPGRKTQNEFNDLVRRGIERAKRKLLMNTQEEQTSGPSEYETVVNGVRYARRKESVPMSAPPQVYVCRRWSCIRNAWVAPDSWDFEEEMIARRRL
ncbi:DUF7833 domain-containing protein, partial [Segatella paludivivens]|uniref:DUF7833 domain-containing protein n=1 Tax=Segatella paludivivens TaxID=185294 RepID=UPI0009D925C6